MDINDLEKKYLAGETTLEEEEFLRENASKLAPELRLLFQFTKSIKKHAPDGLKQKVWKSINTSTIKLRLGIFAAAASVLFLAIFSLQNFKDREMSYEEKEATLKEAIAMFSESDTAYDVKEILYEDELVIIYTSNE